MIEITSMKISYKTKVRETGGSIITTIPMSFVKGLNIEPGDSLDWTMELSEKGATLIVTPNKSKKNDKNSKE